MTAAAGTDRTWADVLSMLTARNDLSAAEAAWAMEEILSGEATPVQIAGFAVGLRTKGESVTELAALVDTMYAHARVLDLPGRWLDVVGTGGDRSMSVNISTMAALVAAGAGAKVAKHGNRSASSQAGAADVLEALGVRLDLTPDQVARVGEEAGVTFCFAPAFHPALRHAAVPRRELAIATVFNFLGPLANPARPAAQAIGCADARMAPLMAGVFARRGVSAWVFRGDDGLDELTTTTTSQVWAVADGEVRQVEVDPARLGLPTATAADLRGGDVTVNADVVRALVDGGGGPVRDAVLLNAGAALAVYAGGTDDPLRALAAGVERARESLSGGDARAALDRWVAASRAAGEEG
jgi:anthranilate phosphoribosyltransferase